MKNFKTKLFAAAMAAPLAMSGVTAVFAEGEATDAQKGTAAPVVKTTVTLAGDINPESLTFTYAATRSTNDGNEAAFTYPAVESQTVTYTASTGGMIASKVDDNNMKTLTATTDLFAGVNYTHAGVYVWNVQQSSNCAEDTETIKRTLTEAPEEYTVKAYVYNKKDGAGFDVTYVVEGTDGKVETTEGSHILTFTNNYSEVRENLANGVFSLTHKVDGELADKTRDFTYTVSFAKPGNAATADIAVEGLTANNDGTYTYTAKHGDPAFKVTKAPVGTVVTITPTNVPDDYTTKWEGANADSNGVVKAAITADGTYLTVTHTKDANKSPITGNIINNLPFLGLIAIALGGFIACIALKRRQNA